MKESGSPMSEQERGLKTTARTTCRLCHSDRLVPVFSLGMQYVSNFVNKGEKGIKAPLELVLCESCSLLQLKHTAPQELLYSRHYWYKSGVTKTMREALKEIAETTTKMAGLKKGDVVLDIGANDGTLLGNYQKGIVRVGCEPANNLVDELRQRSDYVIHDFWNYDSFNKLGLGKAKVITALGMFYDMEDPGRFVADAAKALADDGIFVAQLMCLKNMLEENDVGNICVPPSTLILGDNRPIATLQVGNKVFGGDGKIASIKGVMQRNHSGDLIKIDAVYLEPLVCTSEHPIKIVPKECLRFDCGQFRLKDKQQINYKWVKAEDVKRGDFLVVPRLMENNIDTLDLTRFNKIDSPAYRGGLKSIQLTEDTAWLLGLYVAEGNINITQMNNWVICFNLNKKEYLLTEKIRRIMGAFGYKTTVYYARSAESMTVRVSCTALARALKSWCGPRAREKCIPDFIMISEKHIRKAFLKGLFEGDGYRKGNQMHLHTGSKILALQTQLLVASLGGMMGISHAKGSLRKKKDGYIIKSGESWQLRGKTSDIADIFEYEHIGKSIRHYVTTEDSLLIPVQSVNKEAYSGVVCNVETEGNTYLVSNAVVHNCHEHLEYYSLEALRYLFEKNGLEIFKIEENDINGGSYRLYGRHLKNGSIPFDEKFAKEDYLAFYRRIEENKKKCVDFIKQEVKKGKKIYVYGASTKGNTILQYYGLTGELIEGAADKSQEKWGKYTIGTMIPIMSEDEARKKADYFLIMPYAFLKEFLEREKEWRDRGGRFIVPLPNFRVV